MKDLHQVKRYLPKELVRQFGNTPGTGLSPGLEQFTGVVLFADIAGFTPLLDHYTRLGKTGIEEITLILNNYFGEIIKIVNDFNGDVEKIAGDAVVCFWPVRKDSGASLSDLTTVAAQCAKELQDKLHGYQASPDTSMSMRIAVINGELSKLRVGGVEERWFFLLAGEVMLEIDRILHRAVPGETILSRTAYTHLQEYKEAEYKLKNTDDDCALLDAVPQEPPLALLQTDPDTENPSGLIASFIPRSLRKRLAAGQHEWLNEFRPVSVLFVGLKGLVCKTTADLPHIQDAITTVQSIVYKFGGSLRQFTMDDKGPLVMAIFGLPMHTHDDDPVRCIKAAMAIHENLDSVRIDCTCGITTGNAFCGIVGTDLRSEYAVVAQAANLAVRLMDSTNYIACDENTYLSAANSISFRELEPIHLKGHAGKVRVFQPSTSRKKASQFSSSIVGRVDETRKIADRINELYENGNGSQMILQGEPGIGKSHLLEYCSWMARESGLRVIRASGDSIDTNTPYRIWRLVFSEIFSLQRQYSASEVTNTITSYFKGFDDHVRQLPLLNSVVNSSFPENELTSQMRGDVRAQNTVELLIRVLQFESSKTPLVLILDDCHWIDSASWGVIQRISAEMQPLFLILASRPAVQGENIALENIVSRPSTTHLLLGELSEKDVAKLLCQILKVKNIPSSVTRAVQEHADGNAFYCQELTYMLMKAGVIKVKNDICIVTDELDKFEFPSSVEKVVNGRVDELIPEYQLTLRIASVIGRIFELEILTMIHPIENDRPQLADYLAVLADLNFTPMHTPPPQQSNIFKHAIIQQVLYSQLLNKQRRTLHHSLAEYIESRQAGNLSSYSSTLAHHWMQAGKYEKALGYFMIVSETTLREGAYRESVHSLNETLNCLDHIDTSLSPTEQAHIHRMLGEAHLGLGDFGQAEKSLKKGLTTLGRPWPNKPGLPILCEIFKQMMIRFGLLSSTSRREADLEESKILEFLGHVFYFTEQSSANVLSNFRGLNRLELLGPSSALSSSYLQVGVILSIIGLSGQAGKYFRFGISRIPENVGAAELMGISNYAALFSIQMCYWDDGEKYTNQMYASSSLIGDQRMLCYSLSIRGLMLFFLGYLDESADITERLLALVHEDEKQIRCWAAIEWATILEIKGNVPEALATIQDIQGLLEGRGDTERIWLLGLRARLLLADGQKQEAEAEARKALQSMKASPPTGFYALEGYSATAEVFMAFAREEESVERKQFLELAKQSVNCFRKFARVFPIGRPRFLWLKGEMQELRAPGKGRDSFEKSLEQAITLKMPDEEKRARACLT